jgi:HAMP domain-containing protein
MRRRLIGLTVIAVSLCLVLLRQFFVGDERIAHLALLITLGVTALMILWAILDGARKRIGKATPVAEALIWELPVVGATSRTVESSAEAPASSGLLAAFHFNCLCSKLIVGFLAISLFIAVAAATFTYSYFHHAVERAAKARAAITATTVNFLVLRHVDRQKYKELRGELAEATSRPSVAYAYVEDGEGKLLAYAPNDLPSHLTRRQRLDARLMTGEQSVNYRDENIYEYAERSRLNKRFVVHVGIWQDSVLVDVSSVLGPILLAIIVLVLGVAVIFTFLLLDLHRPLLRLVQQSTRISKGDFSVNLANQRDDELGDLARSFERMRSSLRAVLARIGTESREAPSDRQRQSF